MRVGVLQLPTDPWPSTVERAGRLEELGYHHIWAYDHLSWRRYRDRPWHAAIPWLTGLAAATSTIRLGTLVATPNFRHPATLAKEAMTVDHVSGGDYGFPPPSPAANRNSWPSSERIGRDPTEIARMYLFGAATDERPLDSVTAFTDLPADIASWASPTWLFTTRDPAIRCGPRIRR